MRSTCIIYVVALYLLRVSARSTFGVVLYLILTTRIHFFEFLLETFETCLGIPGTGSFRKKKTKKIHGTPDLLLLALLEACGWSRRLLAASASPSRSFRKSCHEYVTSPAVQGDQGDTKYQVCDNCLDCTPTCSVAMLVL